MAFFLSAAQIKYCTLNKKEDSDIEATALNHFSELSKFNSRAFFRLENQSDQRNEAIQQIRSKLRQLNKFDYTI